jgi:hypothetical protein
VRGYAENGWKIEEWLYKACWDIADHAQMLPEQGLSMPTPNPTRQSRFRTSRNCNPHDLPFCPITARTVAPDFRIRARDGSGEPLQAV